LKKSWHPSTLKNIEKVWLLEQKQKDEEKRTEALRKELEEERRAEELRRLEEQSGRVKKQEERLTWMYQGPGHNTREIQEEYLLGKRRIGDSSLSSNPLEPSASDSASASSQDPSSTLASLDLEAKVREDPFFAIKKREQEVIKQTLSNPLALKKFKADKTKSEKKKEKKSKKEKKEKKKEKKRYGRHDSDSESSDEESAAQKPSEKVASRRPEPSRNGEGRPQRDRSRGRSRSRSRSRSPRRRGDNRIRNRNTSRSRSRSRSRTPRREERRHSNGRRTNSPSPPRSSRREPRWDKGTEHANGRSHHRPEAQTSPKPAPKPRLTEEERQERLRRMQEDAQWNKEYKDQVLKEKEEAERQEAAEGRKGEEEASFLRQARRSAYSSSVSLSDRVQRGIHSLQKTEVAQANFTGR